MFIRALICCILAAALSLGWATPALAGPSMGWGQWTSADLSYADCQARAPQALYAEGLSAEQNSERFWFGTSGGTFSATIICYALQRGSIVTVVAGGGATGGDAYAFAQRIAGHIFNPSTGNTTGNTANGGSGWDKNAVQFRGRNGERFSFYCEPGGSFRSVWGSGYYTDDSSVCTAAVHAGLISQSNGGTVVIEIRPGQSSYQGSDQNGVTTTSYGSWTGTYVFIRQ